MGKQASRMELLERLVWVQEQMVLGVRDVEIVHTISQKYNLSTRQGWNYVKKAYTRFERAQDQKTSAQRGKLIGMAQEAWAKAIMEPKKDYGAIAKILREMARLTGVDPGDIIRGELNLTHKSFTDLVKEGELERDRAKKSGEEGTKLSE